MSWRGRSAPSAFATAAWVCWETGWTRSTIRLDASRAEKPAAMIQVGRDGGGHSAMGVAARHRCAPYSPGELALARTHVGEHAAPADVGGGLGEQLARSVEHARRGRHHRSGELRGHRAMQESRHQSSRGRAMHGQGKRSVVGRLRSTVRSLARPLMSPRIRSTRATCGRSPLALAISGERIRIVTRTSLPRGTLSMPP